MMWHLRLVAPCLLNRPSVIKEEYIHDVQAYSYGEIRKNASGRAQ